MAFSTARVERPMPGTFRALRARGRVRLRVALALQDPPVRMSATITLGVRGSGQIVDVASPDEPQERGTAFAELLSGREFDPGSWSSDAGFAARPGFESRAAPPRRDQPSYDAREREEIEREAERHDAASAAAPSGSGAGPVDARPRATTRERAPGADAGPERSSEPSARTRAEHEAVRGAEESEPPVTRDDAAESGDVGRSGEREPVATETPARVVRGTSEHASEAPKVVARAGEPAPTTGSTADPRNHAGEPAATEAVAAPEVPDAPDAADPAAVDAPPADASEAVGAESAESGPDGASVRGEADPAEAAAADGVEELVAESVEVAEDAAAAEPESRASRPTATAAPVLRASEIARVGEARPELALAPAAGATTTTTASEAALRVVETTASADVGGSGANGSGGSGSPGQGDASAGARAAHAVGAASAPATSARSAVVAASVFPEGGDAAPSWVERIAERMRLARSSDRVELRLALVPKGLGPIDVRLRLDAEGLHATIVAEHEQTRALLAGQQHRLEAALAQEDLNLSSFDLGLDDGGGQDEAPRGERREGGSGARADRSAPESEESQPAANVSSTVPGRLSFWA